jgi:predicted negative regulator of RcsB-dependent stress response
MGAPRAIALCYCFTGALEFQAGAWASAESALRASIRLYREIGAASGEALACQRLGVLLTARGQLDEGLAVLFEGQAVAERALMRAHCLTRIYAATARNRLAANDLSAADQTLSLGLEMSERHGNCTTCDALLLPIAVSVRVAQGAFDSAEAFCRQLDTAAEQYGGHMWVAMAQQSRGELATAQGRLEEALNHYTVAYESFKLAAHRYEAARCLSAITATHRKRGDLENAKVFEREAEAIMGQLGAAV